jgi:hypothetical protein
MIRWVLLCAGMLSACTSGPPPSIFSRQTPKTEPCLVETVGGDGAYSLKVDHHPEQGNPPLQGYASGNFDASVPVWVTANRITTLQRVDIPADKLMVPIPSTSSITALALQPCVAYEPAGAASGGASRP